MGLVEDGEGATCIASAMVLNGEGDAGYEAFPGMAPRPTRCWWCVLGTLPATTAADSRAL
ncbi:MAG: hypothetical protein ACLTMP_00680 [Eggerthella lenta]